MAFQVNATQNEGSTSAPTGTVALESSLNLEDWVEVPDSSSSIAGFASKLYELTDPASLHYRVKLNLTSTPVAASGTITGSVGILNFAALATGESGNSIEVVLSDDLAGYGSASTVASTGEILFTSKQEGEFYVIINPAAVSAGSETVDYSIEAYSESGANPSEDISGGTDDSFNIALNGVNFPVTLSSLVGLDSGNAIAAALETAINTATSGSPSVSVVFTVNGSLEPIYAITLANTSGESTIEVTDAAESNLADDLKLGVANGGTETNNVEYIIVSIEDSTSTAQQVCDAVDADLIASGMVSCSVTTNDVMTFEQLLIAESEVEPVVVVADSVITVSIASGENTADEIADAIEASSEASALISVEVDTAGAMEADSVTLSGGDSYSADLKIWFTSKRL